MITRVNGVCPVRSWTLHTRHLTWPRDDRGHRCRCRKSGSRAQGDTGAKPGSVCQHSPGSGQPGKSVGVRAEQKRGARDEMGNKNRSPWGGGPHLVLWRWEDEDTHPRFCPRAPYRFWRATGRMGVMQPSKQWDGRKSPPWAQNFLF